MHGEVVSSIKCRLRKALWRVAASMGSMGHAHNLQDASLFQNRAEQGDSNGAQEHTLETERHAHPEEAQDVDTLQGHWLAERATQLAHVA